MEAIILAGGFGTRLSHIVKDVPKPMADLNGKPFLEYLLRLLTKNNIDKVIMAVGYKSECITGYFGDTCLSEWGEIDIAYSHEDTPLGTGGAIKRALELCNGEYVYVFNGDTYYDVDAVSMLEKCNSIKPKMMIAIKRMYDFDRYGTVMVGADNKVLEFNEKKYCNEGYINAGVYLIKKNLLDNIQEKSFSFEKAILERDTASQDIFAFLSDGYFIDIGIPEDYYRANRECVEW